MLNKDDERRISAYRDEIDRIDGKLLELLNRRAVCALEIGHIKKRNNEPVSVPDRERAVLARLIQLNPGPLPGQSIEEVFQAVIAQMKKLEEFGSPA
jgi:chorismate mutase/prephenate dehydratase